MSRQVPCEYIHIFEIINVRPVIFIYTKKMKNLWRFFMVMLGLTYRNDVFLISLMSLSFTDSLNPVPTVCQVVMWSQ